MALEAANIHKAKPISYDDSFEKIQPRVETAKRYSEIQNRHIEGHPNQYDTLNGLLTDEFEEVEPVKVH
ncbi:hypothetical protein Y032_0835g2596 [Ancylostoma ceylanicum]|uniref:Uncharacterized protein n=1 Tax=Ancylostoma ceylanicum TaxID=53326 RepID=A0A016WBN7_9BILA|nr:hypothetical protein Y032_0835g2596 [Ancylostoma ceylanicum]